jgi:hypothetical protein
VRLLQRRPLLEQLGRHVVEGHRQLPDLIEGGRLDPLVQLAPRDGGRPFRELSHGAGDPPGHQGGAQAAEEEGGQGEGPQLQPGLPDLRLHPPLGEPDPDGAPLLAADEDGDGEVVDRFPPAVAHRFLGQRRLGLGGQLVDGAGKGQADALRAPTVGGHPALGVEHDRVDHVGLGGHPGHVLLEPGEVIEEERPLRHGGQASGQDLAPALHLADDRHRLAMLDDGDDGGHHDDDDQHRPPQELGLEGAEPEAQEWAHRGRSSQILRSGM